MIRRARDAGASALPRIIRFVALACASATVPALAAEVRLLHADPTVVSVGALPASTDLQAATLQVQFEADGVRHILSLRRNEEMGSLAARLGSRAAAYTGKAGPYAGSWAAVTRIGNRWSGIWYDGGEYFGVDSAGALAGSSPDAAALPPDSLVVFRLRDALWEDTALEDDTLEAPVTGAELARQLAPFALAFPPEEQRRLEVGVIGDALLVAHDGEDAEANLLARLNVIDGLFASQLGVRVSAGSITLYATHDEEPFGQTTSAGQLLDQLSAWRYVNAGQRENGLTHLFTGRNLEGRTVGMAYMDSLCHRRYSTSLSQATTSVGFSALIAAHEIAHVFGAPHDGEATGACAAAPSGYLMSPRINGSQEFSQCSLEQMAPQAQASCLVPVRTGWPAEGPAPSAGGGGGALPAWITALLGGLLAARRRRRSQSLANQSAR